MMNLSKYVNTVRVPQGGSRMTHNVEQTRLMGRFKVDLLEDVGLTDHPKADMAYGMAWERGHAEGLAMVWAELGDLADLMLP